MNTPDDGQKDCRQRYYALLVLAVAVILVFWPVCQHDFVNYDDEINIYGNGLITTPSAANLLVVWQKPYLNLYIPLTYTFWLLQAKLSVFFPAGDGTLLNPHLFHAANLLFHLANALLVFLILKRLLKNNWPALAGALVFAVHPVQVEPVAWVTGFKDVFSGFWSLMAIWQYLTYCRASAGGTKQGRIHYGLTLLFMLCALLAKPGAMSVPVIIALLAVLGVKRGLRQTAMETAPLVILAAPFIILTKMAQPGVRMSVIPDFWQRLLICGDTFSFYLKQLLLPVTIGPYYGRTPEFVLTHDWFYGTGLVPYLLFAWLLWKGGRSFFLLAVGIFVVAILPVSGLVPFIFQASSTVADRYLYMSMLGVALGVGLLVASSPQRPLRLFFFALIALYGLRSMPLVHDWQDSITFNEYGLRSNPQSRVGHNNLGKALLDSGRLAEAYQHFAESVRILPTEIAYNNMGAIREMEGRQEEAMAHYLQSILVNPSFFMTYGNLVQMLEQTDTVAAGVEAFAKAMAGKPQAVTAHLNFGTALLNIDRFSEAIFQLEQAISLGNRSAVAQSLLADALAGVERWDEALSHYQAALALQPNFEQAHNGLGLFKLQRGDLEGAAESFRQALEARPNMLQAMGNLAFTLSSLGRPQEAAQQYAVILALDPNSVAAHNELGRILVNQNQLGVAIEHFRAALQLQPDLQEVKENLEAALAKQRNR